MSSEHHQMETNDKFTLRVLFSNGLQSHQQKQVEALRIKKQTVENMRKIRVEEACLQISELKRVSYCDSSVSG